MSVYSLGILILFFVQPWWLIIWHEKITNIVSLLPWIGQPLDKVAGLAGLFLVGSPRCLNAVTKQYAEQALRELEKVPEVNARPYWVAAPLQINDEVFGTQHHPFAAPANARPDTVYVRGLTELRRHFVGKRWWLSIEGPGGVGKSALAFQLARWFAAPEPISRLNMPQAIPLFIRNPTEGLDQEILAELKRVLNLSHLSSSLFDALLRQRRVLALVDGISEKATDFDGLIAGPLNPSKGAQQTCLAVMTSRRRIAVTECIRVLPRPLNLGSMDGVLNRYLEGVVGAGRFTAEQREDIREALKKIMQELSSEESHLPEVPIVFLKLLVQRADQVMSNAESKVSANKAENTLPQSLGELVDAYLASLMEKHPDGLEQVLRARQAALACVGDMGLPSWRSLAAYESKGLRLEHLNALVTSGLMILDNTDIGDPRFKFTLDPIAEYLAAKELVLALRDGKLDLQRLKSIRKGLSPESDVSAQISRVGRALGIKVDR